MGTTYRQDKDFMEWMMPKDMLESAIDWIQKNMEPEDVFGEDRIMAWCKENYEEES